MKVEKNSGMFPAWLDNFISNYGNKKKVAEINVESLPTVNWKNETYYVQEKSNGATLYTKYGNVVRFIPDSELNTELVSQNQRVEAVNQLLQEDNVVASLAEGEDDIDLDAMECGDKTEEETVVADDEFESELEKVADLEDGLPQETETSTEEGSADGAQTEANDSVTASVSEGVEDMAGTPSEGIEDMVGTPSEGIEDVASEISCDLPVAENCECPECHCEGDECVCEETEAPVEGIPTDDFVTKASYNRLLAKVKNLEKIVKAFSEAQHAYTAPQNDAYDCGSQEQEVAHFQEAAETTQKVIDKEHELDLSKMSDRAKLNEDFLSDLLSVDKENFDAVMDEIKQPEAPVEEVEVVKEEDIPAETEEVPVESVEEVPAETVEEVSEEETPAEMEAEDGEAVPVADVVVVDEIPTEEVPVIEDEPAIVVIDNPEQVEEFVNQTCPACHAKKALNGVEHVAGVTGVVCSQCGKEFAVTDDAIYMNK